MKNLIKKINLDLNDLKLAPMVMVIAGCGFIYQYMLAGYSTRFVGLLEVAIFTVMTIMVLGMGCGSFIAKYFKDKFFAFSILESVIGMFAFVMIFIASGAHAIANILPEIISDTFGYPLEVSMKFGWISTLQNILNKMSYFVAAILGILLGLEIPFLATIREELHKNKKLNNNIGVIYGIDYIGGAIGAFIWIYLLMGMGIQDSIKIVAFTNVIVGFMFILFFRKYIKRIKTALAFQIFTSFFIVMAAGQIGNWQNTLQNSLYIDNLVYSENTEYQNFSVTQGYNRNTQEYRHSLFINGHTQFSDSDEGMYHSLLVYPALISSGLPDNVLIIGGGDGLAARDVLKTDVKKVTLLDLDPRLVEFFTSPIYDDKGVQINDKFIELTEGSFSDERMELIFGDAYLNVKKLIADNRKYGTIIVDLPDPSHPNLNKLYTKEFYEMLNSLLENTGTIVIQSGAPYSGKDAFISIRNTLRASGFYAEQYQHIIPSFGGQWGWTIGVKSLPTVKQRLSNIMEMPLDDEWLTHGKMLSTFEFGKNYYKNAKNIKVNTIDNNATYLYYNRAWESQTRSVFE